MPDAVLSIDLAFKSYKRFGFCVLRGTRTSSHAEFPPLSEFGISGKPNAADFVAGVLRYCSNHGLSVILLDGPQAWKDPQSKLLHCRRCENELFTPAKTGILGSAKPGPALGFVQFSIEVFSLLAENHAELVRQSPVEVSESVLAVETFPTSAWRALGLKPLPSRSKTDRHQIEEYATELSDHFGVTMERIPDHDELQAVVAGLAGLSILEGNPSGYCLAGSPPIYRDDVRCEGFIVNPRL